MGSCAKVVVKMNVFQYYQEVVWSLDQELRVIDPVQVLLSMSVSLVCGFIISLFYRWSYRGSKCSGVFINSLVSLALITTVIITVIGNSLARAFGLVGALSIIRFRTAIKDMQDIVFIFFALAMGMSAGVGLHATAIVGTMFIGIAILILSRINHAPPKRSKSGLQFRIVSSEEKYQYQAIMDRYCERYELVTLEALSDQDGFQGYFNVILKDPIQGDALVRDLDHVEGVSQVVLRKAKFKSRKRKAGKK